MQRTKVRSAPAATSEAIKAQKLKKLSNVCHGTMYLELFIVDLL